MRPIVERLLRLPGLPVVAAVGQRSLGIASLLAALFVLGGGGFAPRAVGSRWGGVLAGVTALALGLTALGRGRELWRRGPVPDAASPNATAAAARARLQLEVGGATLVLFYALLQGLGGPGAAAGPLRYALCAVLLSLYRGRRALLLSGLAVLCEGLLLAATGERQPLSYLTAGGLVALFCALHFAVLRGELWRQRDAHKRQVADAILSLQRQARDFRLLLPQVTSAAARALSSSSDHGLPATAPARDRAEEEALLLRSAVVMVRQNLDALVGLLKRALRLRTCGLLWLPQGAEQLQFVAVSTDSAAFSGQPIGQDMGVIGTVIKGQQPLSLCPPKPGQLPYYHERLLQREGESIAAFLGVPLYEDGKLCGVLCADRHESGAAAAFTSEEEALLLSAVPLIVRGLQSERVFAAVERSQYEHERLYAASKLLNRALTPDEVHRTAFAAVAEICAFDFAALTHYDESARRHTVVAATGDPDLIAASLERAFPDNAGLCAMVVKNRAALPPGGELRDRQAGVPVFDEQTRLYGCESLIVLPLLYNEAAAGTLVVASRTERLFTKDRLDILHVIANQIAVSLDNARMYQAVEAMATTDGLTGLSNRRAFQERLAEMLRRAERQARPLTLILGDIDHFKRINDTYGHLVGDVVLKRVAQVVQSCVRKVDIAARYGGEEFAIVLEATDAVGGRQLAERVRQEVQKLVLTADAGTFGCTLSLGIATSPADGADERLLLQRADQALYYAKRHGRNQAVTYSEVAAELKTAA
jgi:diguanylate cyclase (GGDEF)-like protein